MTNGTDLINQIFVNTDIVPDNLFVLTNVYEQSIFDCSNNISFSRFLPGSTRLNRSFFNNRIFEKFVILSHDKRVREKPRRFFAAG